MASESNKDWPCLTYFETGSIMFPEPDSKGGGKTFYNK